MAAEGYITRPRREAAKKRPIVTCGEPAQRAVGRAVLPRDRSGSISKSTTAPRPCYESGLTVTDRPRRRRCSAPPTARSTRHLRAARQAARASASRRGTCSPRQRRSTRSAIRAGPRPDRAGDIVPALVMSTEATTIRVRVGRAVGHDRPQAGYAWTRKKAPTTLVKPGDLVEVKVAKLDANGRRSTADARSAAGARRRGRRDRQPHRPDPGDGRRRQLRAQPVQPRDAGQAAGRIALQAVRLHGGDRQRLHGRVDPDRRAGQLRRRARTSRRTSRRTTTRNYQGPITLRAALEESRNVPTVALMAGARAGRSHQVRRSSLASRRRCQTYLSVAIGAAEATLLEMTSAYSAFPNQGVRMAPVYDPERHRSRRQRARAVPARAARGAARRHGVHHDEPARTASSSTARRPAGRRRSTGRSAARPARPTTTPTPGSSASIRTSRSASGSASIRRSRSAQRRPARASRCRSGRTS